MKIKKAVITAAGRTQRALPLQTVIDRDGQQKSALQVIIEEITHTGVEEVCVVICPGDQAAYAQAAGNQAKRLVFVEQPEPRGYGHAVYCAKPFTEGEPFLHLMSDHLYISRGAKRCAQQLVDVAQREGCAVSAVQPTRESMLTYYGTIGGTRIPKHPDLYEIERVVEKPTPTDAEQDLIIPGLRAGYYLCFFGMHVLTPGLMDILTEAVAQARKPDQRIQLSDALAKLAGKERYLALELQGRRYNIGVKYGLLTAQLALALEGHDREDVLAQLVELLATRDRMGGTKIS